VLLAFPLAAQRASQNQVALTATSRSVQVGDSSVSENVATARYDLSMSRVRVRLDGSVLRFAAPADTISGHLPIGLRLDFARRPGDTLSAFVRSSSQPLDLTLRHTAALSIAGTSTVDLESTGFGTPAVGGMRLALAFPVGDLALSTRVGFESEPRPDGVQPVYWRGATVRGGLALTGASGDERITASLDVSHSSADSLGGRNLFPGGGSVTVQLLSDLSVLDPFDPLEDERWPIRAVAFYSRPFSDDRSDQPNRIIPQGAVLGALGTMLVSVHDFTLVPSLQLLRESSRSESGTGLLRTANIGSAWTVQAGLDLTIPLGSVFELTPQAGYMFGNVGATIAQTAALRRGRGFVRTTSFNDGIRGSWFAVQLSAAL